MGAITILGAYMWRVGLRCLIVLSPVFLRRQIISSIAVLPSSARYTT